MGQQSQVEQENLSSARTILQQSIEKMEADTETRSELINQRDDLRENGLISIPVKSERKRSSNEEVTSINVNVRPRLIFFQIASKSCPTIAKSVSFKS